MKIKILKANYKEKSMFYPIELVTGYEKQPQTQKPDNLHTLTIKTGQITLLDHVMLVLLMWQWDPYVRHFFPPPLPILLLGITNRNGR